MGSDLLAALNERQREACLTTEGPVLVLAGAGSGKTRTLTYRIAYLMQEQGVDPSSILAFTFTNKAANEMKERVRALVGTIADRMWIGTFHAIAVRILRRDIAVLGYDPHFLVYDADDSRQLMREILKELDLDEKQWPAASVLARISRAKNDLITPETWQDLSFAGRRIQAAYTRYRDRLKALNALDFDDLILMTDLLFERHPEVLEQYHRRFRYILVDEYQDTNQSQYRMIRDLARGSGNLCAVGDDDQSIYGWRGADMSIILNFQRDFPEAKVVRLEENYRSTGTILAAANAVVRHNRERLGKELWTRRGDGEPIRRYEAADEESEAWFIAQSLHEAVRRGYKLSDCAVLYRTNAQSRAIEMALSRAGIPYRMVGGTRFYDRREVKDLLAYLRVAYNPLDELALDRIVNVPRRGIGEVALSRLHGFRTRMGISLFEALERAEEVPDLAGAAQRASKELAALFRRWQAAAAEPGGLAELVERVARESGLAASLHQERGREAEERQENIGELISEARRFEQQVDGQGTLGDFLSWVALATDLDAAGEAAEGQGGVWLMTLHSAKGLEFPVVILAGLEEGLLPHGRSLDDAHALEEERRLFYVGITRARDALFLTQAKSRTIQGRVGPTTPSRFLAEVPPELWQPSSLPRHLDRANRPPVTAVEMREGMKVRHPRFGWGTVVSTRGQDADLEVTIAFPNGGVRAFLARFAQLTYEEAE
ncbi:MAG: UvrD-helicase domain-containing protein [Firmicutes bacterium]|nr:UvrD-helicase domain-containing protein [Bacillota bacterium]